jgi:hypothetical protein
MTDRIIMRRSDDPTTCMCCGRRAHSIGVARPRAPVTTWTCDNPECLKATKDLIMATTADFDVIEQRAIDATSKAMAERILQTCMEACFEVGATDLTALTADQVSLALDSLIVSGALQSTLKDAIVGFGDCIRADVVNGEPPF